MPKKRKSKKKKAPQNQANQQGASTAAGGVASAEAQPDSSPQARENMIGENAIKQAIMDPSKLKRVNGSHKIIEISLPNGTNGTFSFVKGAELSNAVSGIQRQLLHFQISLDDRSSKASATVDARKSSENQKGNSAKTQNDKTRKIKKATTPQVQPEHHLTADPQKSSHDKCFEKLQKVITVLATLNYKKIVTRSADYINEMGNAYEEFICVTPGNQGDTSNIITTYKEKVDFLFKVFFDDLVKRYQDLPGSPVEETMLLVGEATSYLEKMRFNKHNASILEKYIDHLIHKTILELIKDILFHQASSIEATQKIKVYLGRVQPKVLYEIKELVRHAKTNEKLEGHLCHYICDIIDAFSKIIAVCIDFNTVSNKPESTSENLLGFSFNLELISGFCNGLISHSETGSCDNNMLDSLSKSLSILRKSIVAVLIVHCPEDTMYQGLYRTCFHLLYYQFKCDYIVIQNTMIEGYTTDVNQNLQRLKTIYLLRERLGNESIKICPDELKHIEQEFKPFLDQIKGDFDIQTVFTSYFLMTSFMAHERVVDALIAASDLVVFSCSNGLSSAVELFYLDILGVLKSYFDSIESHAENGKNIFALTAVEPWSYALSLCYNLGQLLETDRSKEPASAINTVYNHLKVSFSEKTTTEKREKGFRGISKMCSMFIDHFNKEKSPPDSNVFVAALWVIYEGQGSISLQQVKVGLGTWLNLFHTISHKLLTSEGNPLIKCNIYKYTRNLYPWILISQTHLRTMIICSQPGDQSPIFALADTVFSHCGHVCEITKSNDDLQQTNRLLYNIYKIIIFFVSVRHPFAANLSQVFKVLSALEDNLKPSFESSASEDETALITECGKISFDHLSEETKSSCPERFKPRIKPCLDTLTNFFADTQKDSDHVDQNQTKALKSLAVITGLSKS